MSAQSSPTIFEDTFEVSEVNPEGKKFNKVSRIVGRGENYEMDLVLDVNSEIYKLPVGQKFVLVLAKTLNLDGTPDMKTYNQSKAPSLMDGFQYVMHGKVFKILQKGSQDTNIEIFVSYGGLLMSLKGESRHVSKIEPDMRIYLLLRTIN